MWHRTWRRLVSLPAARQLLGLEPSSIQVTTRTPTTTTTTLPVVLDVLQEHYLSGDEELVRAALQHVVQLDQTNADTALLAALHVSSTTTANSTGSNASPQLIMPQNKAQGGAPFSHSANATPSSTCHLIVQLMRRYPHACDIRARCCRCLANLCQLSQHTTQGEQGNSLVDTLLQQGALEQALGTLAMSERLDRKGQCWAAMAVCNLTCLGHEGTVRAMRADGEVALAEFILSILSQETYTGQHASDKDTLNSNNDDDVTYYTDMALDAALSALTACLTSEATENAHNISYNYEKVSYVALDALVRVILRCSAILVRDGRDDGVYEGCLPALRHATLDFCSAAASQRQRNAIARLLPLLHKAWMALHYVSSHPPNLPLIYNTLYEADEMTNTNEQDRKNTLVERRVTQGSLYVMTEAALFLVAELEGLQGSATNNNETAMQSDALVRELGRLQAQTQYYILATMADLTATRKDVDTARLLLGQQQQQEAAQMTPAAESDAHNARNDENIHVTNSEESTTVSSVLPTQAARHVSDVLASGAVGNMALATAVRLCVSPHDGQVNTISSDDVLVPWPHESFALLTKALLILTHLASRRGDSVNVVVVSDGEDEVAVSVNAMAAMQAMLRQAHRALLRLAERYDIVLHHLYYSESATGDLNKAERDNETVVISPSHRLLFVQYTALVGQVYALLWGALRSESGARAIVELDLARDVCALQELVRAKYETAVERAHKEGSNMDSTSGDKSWVPNAAEESTRLVQSLGTQLSAAMEALTRHTSKEQRTSGGGRVTAAKVA